MCIVVYSKELLDLCMSSTCTRIYGGDIVIPSVDTIIPWNIYIFIYYRLPPYINTHTHTHSLTHTHTHSHTHTHTHILSSVHQNSMQVPAVYVDYTSRRVLTMEFIEGTKGPWDEGGERMLTVGLQCSVLQLLGAGYFHSDPHRGNLLQTRDGKLGYLDFGYVYSM